MLATKLEKELSHRGYSVWLDTHKKDKSEAAMEEAVKNSMVVLAVITQGTPNPHDDNAYLKRPFCLSELRWAFEADKHVQPIVHMDDKKTIGEFINMAPTDLKRIGQLDFVDLNTTDQDYWSTGISKIFEKAQEAGALPSSGGGAGTRKVFDKAQEAGALPGRATAVLGRSSSYKLSSVAPMTEKDTELTGPTAGVPAGGPVPASPGASFDSVESFS